MIRAANKSILVVDLSSDDEEEDSSQPWSSSVDEVPSQLSPIAKGYEPEPEPEPPLGHMATREKTPTIESTLLEILSSDDEEEDFSQSSSSSVDEDRAQLTPTSLLPEYETEKTNDTPTKEYLPSQLRAYLPAGMDQEDMCLGVDGMPTSEELCEFFLTMVNAILIELSPGFDYEFEDYPAFMKPTDQTRGDEDIGNFWDLLRDSHDRGPMENDDSFTLEEIRTRRDSGRNARSVRTKGRKRKRGKSQHYEKEYEPRPPSKKKTKCSGRQQDVSKKPEKCSAIRRNPSRAVGAPADYNENKNNPRGNHLTSEYKINLLTTCKLPRRAYNKRGAYTGGSSKDPAMSDTFWPADTLERPTLAAVAEQIPTPPKPLTWGVVAHHILQCVLTMLHRYHSQGTVGMDHVAGKISYIESIIRQLSGCPKELKVPKKDDTENDELNIDGLEENRKEMICNVLPKDWTGKEEVIVDENHESAHVNFISDTIDSVSEDKICYAVREVMRRVRAVEERLREQNASRILKNIFDNDTQLLDLEQQVPGLNDINKLLVGAVLLFCQTNRDVSEKDVDEYVSWAYTMADRNFN